MRKKNFVSNPVNTIVQLLGHVQLCEPKDGNTPGFPVLHQVPELVSKLMSIRTVMPFSHLILCRPLLFLSSVFPRIRVSSN